MKNILVTSILALGLLVGFTANAQNTKTVTSNVAVTNTVTAPTVVLADSAKGMPMELTLGGAGVTDPKTGSTEFGFNFTLSVQPLKQPIWFGISQELGWSPSLVGATDLYSDWAWRIYKEKLYLNTGWSVGTTYDRNNIGWRTRCKWVSGQSIEMNFTAIGIAIHIMHVCSNIICGSWCHR